MPSLFQHNGDLPVVATSLSVQLSRNLVPGYSP